MQLTTRKIEIAKNQADKYKWPHSIEVGPSGVAYSRKL